jgi:hypothetical protein
MQMLNFIFGAVAVLAAEFISLILFCIFGGTNK